jgi:uracil phosphoribosyltransferase
MKVVELRHPLVQHKLGHLRDATLDPVRFRQFAGEIGMMLAYEACRDLPTEDVELQTWSGRESPWCPSCAPDWASCRACRQ